MSALSEKTLKKIRQFKRRYPSARSALLPALHLAQAEHGWLSPEVEEEIAELLDLEVINVREVVTFYTMFNQRPVGQYHLQVCTNLSCDLWGAEGLMDMLRGELGVGVGETTDDGLFTLSEVECLGSCGTAPMMMVNDRYEENLTPKKLQALLGRLRKKAAGS